MNFKEAAYHVLKKEKKPLAAKDITVISIKEGLIASKGKTPIATMGAIIYTDIKAKGESSIFVKKKRGLFGLREWETRDVKKEEKMYIQPGDTYISIIDKLRKKQHESKTPEGFENALKEAFGYFGFKAELIGRSGDTDVLLTADIGDETYKITVDGKTAKKGKILESQINWDSLEDHRKNTMQITQ